MPGPWQVLFEQDLGHEVTDLGAGDEGRAAAFRLPGRDHEGVRGAGAQSVDAGHLVAEAAETVTDLAAERQFRHVDRQVRELFLKPGRGLGDDVGLGRRAGVGEDPAEGVLLSVLVVELALVRGDRGFRVVGAAEIAEDPGGGLPVELLLRFFEDQGVVELAPSALAEDATDQGGGGDHVGGLPVLGARRMVQGEVLAGDLGRIEAALGDVLVDARDVADDVSANCVGIGLVSGRGIVELLLEVGLLVRAALPDVDVHAEIGAAGEARELAAAGVAQGVHEEEAVLGSGIAGAEHGARAGRAVDVGGAELVADDRDVVARAVGPVDVGGLDAEAAVVEVVVEIGLVQRRIVEDQVRIWGELVVAVGRQRSAGLHRDQVGDGSETIGARGEDRVETGGVTRLVRLRRRSGIGRVVVPANIKAKAARHDRGALERKLSLDIDYDCNRDNPRRRGSSPDAGSGRCEAAAREADDAASS